MKSQENKTINTPSRVTTLTTDEWIGFLLPWATKKYYSARANFEYDNNTNKKSGDNDSQIKFNLVVVFCCCCCCNNVGTVTMKFCFEEKRNECVRLSV